MTYENLVGVTQILSLVFFIAMFACVVAYALWPGNKEKFKHAARLPLEPGDIGDKNGAN